MASMDCEWPLTRSHKLHLILKKKHTQAEALFDSFVPIDEEDRFNMPLDGIVEFASAIGIDDPEGVRVRDCWRLMWGVSGVAGWISGRCGLVVHTFGPIKSTPETHHSRHHTPHNKW